MITTTGKKYLIFLSLTLLLFSTANLKAAPSQQQLTATFETFIVEIKKNCKQEFGNDETKFRSCVETKYQAMRSFFEKLFHYRDTKGLSSNEFQIGIKCIDKSSPPAFEEGRKVAVERADWINANSCYQSALP